MIRVLVLIKGLGRGGAEQLAVGSIRHLDASRVRCDVAYLLPRKDALVGEVRALGVDPYCLGTGFDWPLHLRTLIARNAIDIVHSHSPAAASVARLVSPRSTRHIYTEHNVWPRYRTSTRWANLATFPRNDHVLAVSANVAASIRAPGPLAGRMPPVETLHHGIDLDRVRDLASGPDVREELSIPAHAPLVSVVANLKAHKGHDTMLLTAREVARRRPDVRFLLMGVGPLEGRVREGIARLGLERNVRLLGFRDDVPRIVAASDAFALASTHEGLPVSLLEAMALGVPPVVTRVGGCAEVVTNGRDGLLVEPGDPIALASALERVLSDRVLAGRLSDCARARAEAFDLSVAAGRIGALYEEVTGP